MRLPPESISRPMFPVSPEICCFCCNTLPPTLRHSFAIHLLEQGVDICYIQELLRHAHPETTMTYSHDSWQGLLLILSQLDLMYEL